MLIPDPLNDGNFDPSEHVFVVSLSPESDPGSFDSRSRGGDPLSRPFLGTAITRTRKNLASWIVLKTLLFKQGSLKADEESLKGQILSLNEQFKLLVKSVAEKFPEIMDDKFPQKIAAKRQLLATPNKDPTSAANEPSGITTPTKGSRIPTYTRLNFSGSRVSPHRIPSLDSQRFPRGFVRRSSEETEAMMREQFQRNVNSGLGINARKIRDSLPNSPTCATEPYSRHLENSDEDEKRRLKQKRTDSKNIDVVNLGLF